MLFVEPRSHPAFERPTDLEGISAATYDEEYCRENPVAALGPACTQIREAMKKSASFNRTVTVVAKLLLANPATSSLTYPKKLDLHVTNPERSAVVVISRYFEITGRLKGHAERSVFDSRNKFKVEFLAYTDKSGKDIYQLEYLLRPGASVRAWLALDNATDDAAAREARAATALGRWRITCHWLAEPMEVREYEFDF